MDRLPLPSADVLRLWLDYEPDTGRLVWRNVTAEMCAEAFPAARYPKRLAAHRNGLFAGQEAGGVSKTTGYRHLSFLGKSYLAHRIIWRLHYGIEPSDFLDHANGDRADNRICNLREATHAQNSQNSRPLNGRRYKGVTRVMRPVYSARITVDGRVHNIGTFITEEEAARAYDRAAIAHFGGFARINEYETLPTTPAGDTAHPAQAVAVNTPAHTPGDSS